MTAQPALSWPISPGWTCIRPSCPPVWSPLCRLIVEAPGYTDGLVRREANHLARRATRDTITPDRRRALHQATLRRAAELGIGAVHEIAGPHIAGSDDLRDVLALGHTSDGPAVVGYWGATGAGVALAGELGCVGAAGDLNIDGSLGSRTARLSTAYADAPGERGYLYVDLDLLTEHIVACTQAGLQAGFHCIGDEAVGLAVAALTRAAERCGRDAVIAARHRLEHVEMITPELVDDMARLVSWRACSRASTSIGAGTTGCTRPAWVPSGREP